MEDIENKREVTTENQTVEEVARPVSTKGPWQKFVSKVWDKDYYDKSDAERRLVHKLDMGILTCLAFGYLMKYIDQTNLSNAYVSGMKEDLGIEKNEYTYMVTIYNCVICVMTIPSNLIALKIRPSWLLAGCEIGWMIFTFAQAGAHSVHAMYGFRFCVALFEAAFAPAAIFLLGSWYSPPELAKRVTIWFISGIAGQAFSGYMQAAIYRTLDGVAGLAGWRWLYIICGLMTLPTAATVAFVLPDYPSNTKVWYLSEEEKEMAKRRCANRGVRPATGIIDLKTFKQIMSTWHVWLLVPTYCFYAWSVQSYGYFATYLKMEHYSVYMRNILPSTAFVIGIPVCVFWGFLSDRLGTRFGLCLGPLLWGLIPVSILAFWGPPTARLFAFMVEFTYFVTHIYFAWINEICRGNAEERAFIIGATTSVFYAFNAWLPTVVFLQTDGPRWKKGFPTLFGANILACCGFVAIWLLQRRDEKRKAASSVQNDAPFLELI